MSNKFDEWYFEQRHLGIEPIDHAKATWDYRQTDVDELEQIIKLRDQQLTDEVSLSTKYVAKCVELQKRVDVLSKRLLEATGLLVEDLEQALKGGGE